MKTILAICMALAAPCAKSAKPETAIANFQLSRQIAVRVLATKADINYSVTSADESRKSVVPLDIETEPHLDVRDFNFDGHPDFAVWYLDEGMGTHTIHRIFIFEWKTQSFVEIKPRCGDEFLNLRVDKTKRTLLSTYYLGNLAKVCFTRFPKTRSSSRVIHK